MKVTKKLVLGKVSIVNLEHHTMEMFRGGLNQVPQENTDTQGTNVAPVTTIVTVCSNGGASHDFNCL